MDRLRADGLRRARETPPPEKAAQALEVMQLGIDLQRANLRRRHPTETEARIDARLKRWLARDA